MIQVISSRAAPTHLSRLHEWLVAEWDEIDTFEFQKEGVKLPAPLLAVHQEDLLGGLVFSTFRRPGGSKSALWINALFVVPEYRGQGVASRLVRAAEDKAVRSGEQEMFALTNIPELYVKLWMELRGKRLRRDCNGPLLQMGQCRYDARWSARPHDAWR
jgi:GNAT superfamily N-acetyltransferase